MEVLRQYIPKEYGVEEVGHLPDGGLKVRILGVHEINMREVQEWRDHLGRAGWQNTLLFDMDDESLTFVLRKGTSYLWTYTLLLGLILVLILRLSIV